MNTYYPSYYHQFRCLASQCPDSCCKEWEVDIDPDTAAAYRALPGELGDHLRRVMRQTPDGVCMTIKNGRCPMWRQDGLCRIQAQLGYDALSRICREYPRISHDFGQFTEYGLELSCPEAARLILTTPYEMVSAGDMDGAGLQDLPDDLSILLQSRRTALEFLKTTSLPLPQALAVLLLYAHGVQSQLDGGAVAALLPEEALATAKRYAGACDITALTGFFLELEILTEPWRNLLLTPRQTPCWDGSVLALARYGIYRYWLQAVSDTDLICRVKFLIAACTLVAHLEGDPIRTAQLFSKEIENDPENMQAILDGAYTAPALTDVHLLSLLLGKERQ